MSTRKAEAIWVLVGVPLIIAGFAVNPGPSTSDTTPQLVAYGLSHQTALTVGGWLQVTGTVLTVIFAISIVVFCPSGQFLTRRSRNPRIGHLGRSQSQ